MQDHIRDISSKFALTNEQSTLFGSLYSRNERIAQMYLGALIALNAELDPERLCKAAYEMRELMEKISEIVDVETAALKETMGSKVAELEKEFRSMTTGTNLKPPNWDGAVDGPVRKFLNKMQDFLDWKANNQPQRFDAFTRTFRALDGPGRLLPQDIEKRAVKSWMEAKEFFDKVAHHRFQPTETVLMEKIAYVEDVLLNKLNPKTFADFDRVDAIIDEGEQK